MQTPSIAQPMTPGALNTSPVVDKQEQVEEIKEIEELEQEEEQQQLQQQRQQQQQESIHDPRPQHISITTEGTTPHRSSSDNANPHNNNNKTTGFPTGQGHSNGTSSLNTRTRYEPKCRLEDSVTPSTLLAHLRLLRFLQTLVIIDDEDLDFLFLIRSEERYLMFLDLLQQLQPPPAQVPLPPLDVALMWTVHMLAPFRYHEDLLRSYGPHLLNYAFPLERYVAAIDIENATTDNEAFAPSKEMWYQLYPAEQFDLDRNDATRMFEIQCLWCSSANIMDSSTFIKFRIDGIAIDCPGCGSQCSLETLSSKRLWDGIKDYQADSSILLAGSLLSPWSGTPDLIAAQREHRHLFFHPRIQFGLDQASVALNCSWPKVVQAFQDLGPDQYYGIRPTTLARIISSYMGLIEDRLSMDLVAGALRQRDFQKAMMIAGGQAWCQAQVLQRSLDRYQRFMLLARAEDREGGGGKSSNKKGRKSKKDKSPGAGQGGGGRQALVPTLDIDLAWHTHMLSPAHYRQYQLVHYARVLNHDDSVQATSSMTKQDFIRTAELWQDLYQERYSSQQWEVSRFLWTPEKICAGSKRAIKKNLKFKNKSKVKSKQKQGDNLSLEGSQQQTASQDSGAGIQQRSGLNEKSEEEGIQETGLSLTRQDSQEIEDLDISPSLLEKGKEVEMMPLSPSNQSWDTKRDSGSHGSSKESPNSTRSRTSAVGLDGRVSNWNGETTGPDGQASCSSGACIMSPWNEVQDLALYVDFQQQQQRELRSQRT
ncbi:hypothetical protein BG006_008427 [Podila minutissima]|uniref:Uncharacterized protein n=1 Tax=Podila minutissima TaxID=64525 RepID=A0A9P5SVR9_9FUNG|nr:hypothetical protein BG006_008427 [Podila minutissima]